MLSPNEPPGIASPAKTSAICRQMPSSFGQKTYAAPANPTFVVAKVWLLAPTATVWPLIAMVCPKESKSSPSLAINFAVWLQRPSSFTKTYAAPERDVAPGPKLALTAIKFPLTLTPFPNCAPDVASPAARVTGPDHWPWLNRKTYATPASNAFGASLVVEPRTSVFPSKARLFGVRKRSSGTVNCVVKVHVSLVRVKTSTPGGSRPLVTKTRKLPASETTIVFPLIPTPPPVIEPCASPKPSKTFGFGENNSACCVHTSFTR